MALECTSFMHMHHQIKLVIFSLSLFSFVSLPFVRISRTQNYRYLTILNNDLKKCNHLAYFVWLVYLMKFIFERRECILCVFELQIALKRDAICIYFSESSLICHTRRSFDATFNGIHLHVITHTYTHRIGVESCRR